MIDQHGQARLADFGLLTLVSDPLNTTNTSSVTNAGTTRWMSPELLHPEEFGFEQSRPTKQSDCYALGMVILEVLSGEPPFARDKDFIVMRKVIDGERPRRPEGAFFTNRLWMTLEKCWSPQPTDRPSGEAVLECLGQVSKNWQPRLPPVAEGVEVDGNEPVFITSQGRFSLHFVPTTPLTTRKDIFEFVSDPPNSKKQVEIGTPHEPFSFTPAGPTSTEEDIPLPNEFHLQGSDVSRTRKHRQVFITEGDFLEEAGGAFRDGHSVLLDRKRSALGPPPSKRRPLPLRPETVIQSNSTTTQAIQPLSLLPARDIFGDDGDWGLDSFP